MKEESQALLGEKETGRHHSEMCSSCDPKSRVHRYILLVFICLIGVGRLSFIFILYHNNQIPHFKHVLFY
jgi:hypothetical protein